MIRVIELFSGIGAQAEALKELGLDYEVVATADIDKHANIGYEAIHGPVNNLGDVTKIEHLPECDLLTFSWPCQSLSVAGRQEGMKEGSGTTSSLLWEVIRLLKDMQERKCLPEVLLAENVDAVLNKKNVGEFKRMLSILSDLGYTTSYQIMNAKDYGTPQNRRRMFLVATLTMGEFVFPEPCPDGRVLRDVLEKDVPESYFLSEKRLATFQRHKARNDAKGNGFAFKVHKLTDEQSERERGDVACAVSTNADRYCQTWIGIPKSECQSDTGVKIVGELQDSSYARARNVLSGDGVSPTITTEHYGPVTPKIEVTGNLGGYEKGGRVYSETGVAPSVNGRDFKEPSKIIVGGNLNVEGWHNSTNEVFSADGVSPCIVAQSNNTKTKIIVPEIEIKGKLNEKGHFDCIQRVYGKDGASPTVTDHVPMMEDND